MFCTECWEPLKLGRHRCASKPAKRGSVPAGDERAGFNRQRALELAVLYRGGCTLQEIGDAIGISRERVRQLLAAVGMDKRGESRSRAVPLSQLAASEMFRRTFHTGRRERRERATRNMEAWRVRITEALKVLHRELGRTPSYTEVAFRLGLGDGTNQASCWYLAAKWLGPDRRSVKVRSYAAIMREMYATAGLEPRKRGGRLGRPSVGNRTALPAAS